MAVSTSTAVVLAAQSSGPGCSGGWPPPGFLAASGLVLVLRPREEILTKIQEGISMADNNLFDHVWEQVVFE